MKTLINLCALITLAAAGASASIITITLDNPNQSAPAGATVSFFGTITNTDPNLSDAAVFLNGDTLDFGKTDATINDNFFANVPLSLAPGQSSGDIDLFEIILAKPETDLIHSFSGQYILLGGMDGGAGTASDSLASTNFSTTPEPASLLLFGTGLVFTGWQYRRRKAL